MQDAQDCFIAKTVLLTYCLAQFCQQWDKVAQFLVLGLPQPPRDRDHIIWLGRRGGWKEIQSQCMGRGGSTFMCLSLATFDLGHGYQTQGPQAKCQPPKGIYPLPLCYNWALSSLEITNRICTFPLLSIAADEFPWECLFPAVISLMTSLPG